MSRSETDQRLGGIFLSIELQQTGYLVHRFYKAAFGNIPGGRVPVRLNEFNPDRQQISQNVVVGTGNWVQQLETNKQAYAQDFVTRSRFINAFPALQSLATFVNALFANAGVTPLRASSGASPRCR